MNAPRESRRPLWLNIMLVVNYRLKGILYKKDLDPDGDLPHHQILIIILAISDPL